jgi:hypothetical protein
VYVVIMRPKSIVQIRLALLVVAAGTILYWIRRRHERRAHSPAPAENP